MAAIARCGNTYRAVYLWSGELFIGSLSVIRVSIAERQPKIDKEIFEFFANFLWALVLTPSSLVGQMLIRNSKVIC